MTLGLLRFDQLIVSSADMRVSGFSAATTRSWPTATPPGGQGMRPSCRAGPTAEQGKALASRTTIPNGPQRAAAAGRCTRYR